MLTQSKALLGAAFLLAAAAAWGLVGPARAAPVPAGMEMSLGDPNAKLVVVEYASMSCPHCAEFANQTFARFKADHIDTGKVRYVFREYPLDQPAVYGAILARCAGPERYFPFIDMMFRQQATWVLAPDPVARLTQIAQLGGLPAEEFQACLQDRAIINAILETRLTGERTYNVASTPTFIIGTQVVEGALPYEQFKQALDDAIAGRPIARARDASGPAAGPPTGNTMTLYVALGVVALLVAGIGFFFLRRPKQST